jgi:putative transposase
LKLLYMGIQNASQKWTMPLQNWNLTLSQLSEADPKVVE